MFEPGRGTIDPASIGGIAMPARLSDRPGARPSARPSARLASCVALLAVAVTLASCTATENPLSLGEASEHRVTVGSQGNPENEILAQIYGQVLEQAGYSITYEQAIGARVTFIAALEGGKLDLVPDYSGALLYDLDSSASATSTADIGAALPEALEPFGLVALAPSPADNGEAVVVAPAFAAATKVASIADLAPLAPTITIGARTGFDEQYFGALEEKYGVVDLGFQGIDGDGSVRVADLIGDLVQVTSISATSPLIAENELVVLDDTEDLFVAHNVTPVINEDALTDEIEHLLNEVSARLTTRELRGLNAFYAGPHKPTAAALARSWLVANGLAR